MCGFHKRPLGLNPPACTRTQSAQTILTQFDSKLGQRALEALQATGVEVRTGVRVTKVTRNQVRPAGFRV